MNKEKLGQEPAFAVAAFGNGEGIYDSGMSKRFYAAIALKVPDSGEEWLDEMIRKANRRDAACAAMNGMLSNGPYHADFDQIKYYAEMSVIAADELLKQENE